MLTLPDIKAKQLAIIQTQRGSLNILQLKNDNLLYRRDGKVVSQCSLHRVFCVVIIGDLAITTQLVRKVNEFGVNIMLLKTNLKQYALFGAQSEGNYLLRQQQYLLPEERSLAIARQIVSDKINNQIVLLKSIKQPYEVLIDLQYKANMAQSRESLLGFEGSASKYFFARYFADCNWKARMPRAKPDEVNFLLDIGYTVAFNFSDVFLRLFGFDSYKGIYHQLFFARKSLACDVVEPFRCLIERRLRTAINLKIVKPEQFKNGRYGVWCDPEQSANFVALFAQVTMDEREEFYKYTRALYRHIMDERNPMPTFKIER